MIFLFLGIMLFVVCARITFDLEMEIVLGLLFMWFLGFVTGFLCEKIIFMFSKSKKRRIK